MAPQAGYKEFADVYDALTFNIPYKKIAEYYDKIIGRFDGGKNLCDLGCGTGSLTALMAKKGYNVIGADASSEMLSIAYNKPHKGITYINQNMIALDLPQKQDVIISTLDSINHLKNGFEVMNCFKAVSKNLRDKGLFVFDINTVYKHKYVLGNNTFVYDIDNVFCVWQNSYSSKNAQVKMDLDFFVYNGNGGYLRKHDRFSEIALKCRTVLDMLENAGFEVLIIKEYLSGKAPNGSSEKVMLAAKKL